MALVPLTSNFMPLQPCNAKSDLSASRYSTWWAMRRGDLSTDKVRSKSCLKERSVSPRTHLFGDTPASITTLTRCVENIQGVPLACDLARSGSKSGTAFFQVGMRQPVYDGCAADRTQAVLLQGFRALRRLAPNYRISNISVVDPDGAVVRHSGEACEEADIFA